MALLNEYKCGRGHILKIDNGSYEKELKSHYNGKPVR